MSVTETKERSEYIEGLRALADLLEAHPEVPTPYHGNAVPISIFCFTKDTLIDTARAFPGKLDKEYDDDAAHFGFKLNGNLAGLAVQVYGKRAQVCERVVTGTREVTEMVPAPDAPMVEVTRTIEDVEWVCSPLLAEVSA